MCLHDHVWVRLQQAGESYSLRQALGTSLVSAPVWSHVWVRLHHYGAYCGVGMNQVVSLGLVRLHHSGVCPAAAPRERWRRRAERPSEERHGQRQRQCERGLMDRLRQCETDGERTDRQRQRQSYGQRQRQCESGPTVRTD